MGLLHATHFVEYVIKADEMLQAMGNEFVVVSSRNYIDKKGILPNGKTLTLQVIQDNTDYGISKTTGLPLENNVKITGLMNLEGHMYTALSRQ